MMTYLLLVVLFLCFVHILFNYNSRARMIKKMPGPDGAFICGTATETLSMTSVQMFDYFRCLAKKYTTISSMWAFPYGVVNLYMPEDIEILLSTVKHNQKSLFYDFLDSWLKDGLLKSYGEKWQRRRKILSPAFNFQLLKQFCAVFEEGSLKLVEVLKASQAKPFDVSSVLTELTLSTICETAMGIKLRDEKPEEARSYINALIGIGYAFTERCSKVYFYPKKLYELSSARKGELKHANTIYSFTKKVIETKIISNIANKQHSEYEADTSIAPYKRSNTAFLDLLLSLQKCGVIDEQGVHEEVNTFMFEGHETTSNAVKYALMLIANNKHIEDKILAELEEIFGESDRTATIGDLMQMNYLDRCIKESLRLYPPVSMIGRVLSDETVLSGYRVPAGTQCAIHIYDLHRRGDIYKDPLVFDPDRFLPENCKDRHRYAYLAFSAGPRNCIGQKFAMLQMKSILSSVIREFHLEPITTPTDLKFKMDLLLNCAVPINISFIPRKK